MAGDRPDVDGEGIEPVLHGTPDQQHRGIVGGATTPRAQPQDPANGPKRHAAGWVGHDRVHSASSHADRARAPLPVPGARGLSHRGRLRSCRLARRQWSASARTTASLSRWRRSTGPGWLGASVDFPRKSGRARASRDRSVSARGSGRIRMTPALARYFAVPACVSVASPGRWQAPLHRRTAQAIWST